MFILNAIYLFHFVFIFGHSVSVTKNEIGLTMLQSTNILRYCTVIWTVGCFVLLKNLFNQSAARATLLYLLCFSRLMRNEPKDSPEKKCSWMINNLLDVLERSIAEYFYSLFVGQVKIRHNL